MTAKEMFEKLGYTPFVEENILGYGHHKLEVELEFNTCDKTYMLQEKYGWEYRGVYTSIDLHKAITKQMEELGWL